jgi:uncharacterized Zn-binding protein involved in type VI secretion
MGVAAAVRGDIIQGVCVNHLIPGPAGAPVKAPPMSFTAPLINTLATTVMIQGKPAAVVGSTGLNVPPHAGLHSADPFQQAATQIGRVYEGSKTVLIEGKSAARMRDLCNICFGLPLGKIVATADTVLIGD